MRSSLRKLVRLVIWGSLWMLSACQPAEPPAAPAPNLILIVIDSLRADHLGSYGYPRATSPNLDALAKNGVLFRHAFSPSSWTKPAIGSLFTSRHPSGHRAISVARPLDASIPTLAELLQSAGYQTVGVTGNFVHINHHSGMDRGYGSWLSHVVQLSENERGKVLWRAHTPSGDVSLRAPEANELNREVAKRLPQKGEKPLFLRPGGPCAPCGPGGPGSPEEQPGRIQTVTANTRA